jgi:hypothetical protein
LEELAETPQRASVNARYRRFEPGQQIAARLEVAGPQRLLPTLRGGIDLRGDGSRQAYVGGVRRQRVEPRKRETPVAALRRKLEGAGGR